MPVNHEIEKAASQFDKKIEVISSFYTHGQVGMEPVIVKETDKHYAKSITNLQADRTDYYIKLNSYNRLYNPFDITFHRTNYQDRIDNSFRKVKKECFLTYLQYLKTRKSSLLSHAERLVDG